jgi:integrase
VIASIYKDALTEPAEEVFTIRKENVHLVKRYLFVPVGKTRFARRNVPLTDAAVGILKRRLAKAKGCYVFAHRRDTERPLTTVYKQHVEEYGNSTSLPSL